MAKFAAVGKATNMTLFHGYSCQLFSVLKNEKVIYIIVFFNAKKLFFRVYKRTCAMTRKIMVRVLLKAPVDARTYCTMAL